MDQLVVRVNTKQEEEDIAIKECQKLRLVLKSISVEPIDLS